MPPARTPTNSRISGVTVVERCLRAWTVGVMVFLYLPIAVLVAYSFNASRLNLSWQGFTFDWYRQLFLNGPLKQAALNVRTDDRKLLAAILAKLARAPLLLISATPSIESLARAELEGWTKVTLAPRGAPPVALSSSTATSTPSASMA